MKRSPYHDVPSMPAGEGFVVNMLVILSEKPQSSLQAEGLFNKDWEHLYCEGRAGIRS